MGVLCVLFVVNYLWYNFDFLEILVLLLFWLWMFCNVREFYNVRGDLYFI